MPTPSGVVTNPLEAQPFQGCSLSSNSLFRGSRATRQPWAMLRNRFAVDLKDFHVVECSIQMLSRCVSLPGMRGPSSERKKMYITQHSTANGGKPR